MSTAVNKPPAPHIPTQAELVARMRAMTPGLRVYNPSDEWLNPEVHGRTDIWIPPDKNGAIEAHPITGKATVCDGVLEVRGRYLTQKDSSGKVIDGQDAGSAVQFLVNVNNYGQMGVRWLSGVNDEEEKRAARDIFAEYQRKADEEIVARRREFKTKWEHDPSRRGEPCPPPTEKESEALMRLQMYERRKGFLYECPESLCPGYATNDWPKFEMHMKLAHQTIVKRSDFDDPKPAPAAARGRGAKKGDDEGPASGGQPPTPPAGQGA